MLKVELSCANCGKALHTHKNGGDVPILCVTNHAKYAGVFKAAQRETAGTTVIVSVNGNDAVTLTDLIITSDKVNGASLTVQVTDGINTVILASANVTDAPCNIALGFVGNWTTWQASHVDLVTVGTVKATVSLGYYKVPAVEALAWAAWNALR